MRPPLFSIVTVTLNCADDAVRTTESIAQQSFVDYEHIVKDGGSSDRTPELVRQRIGHGQVYVSPDAGIYNAMNQALDYCSGRYICFLNAGDLFSSQETLAQVAAFIQSHPEPAFIYGDVHSYVAHPDLNHDHTALAAGREIAYPEQINRFYLYRKMICHQAWFVNREVYQRLGGFDERYRLLADYAFLLRMALREQISYAHVPVIVAIYQGGGLSEKQATLAKREKQAIKAANFHRWEHMIYGAATGNILAAARRFVYRHVFARIPAVARKRLSGW